MNDPVLPLDRRTPLTQHYLSQGRIRRRDVEVPVADADIDALDRTGYLLLPGLLHEDDAAALAETLERRAQHEQHHLGGRGFNGYYYVRHLLGTEPRLVRFLGDGVLLPLARAMLGPQVRVMVDARVVAPGNTDEGVEWHVHLPGARAPLPRWYSVPHSLNYLIYLDDVTPAEGGVGLLPGSHRRFDPLAPPAEDTEGEVILQPRRGDCLAIHGHLRHRTVPATPAAGPRRVLFVAFTAAWVEADTVVDGQPERPDAITEVATTLRRAGLPLDEIAELCGGFRW